MSAEKPSERQDSFLLAQYASLREEVLKRVEIQHQLILGTLVAVGSILTVGTQGDSASILLLYPFLAIFLTLAWSQNDHRNRQIAQHLALHEKLFLTDLAAGWEHSRSSSRLWVFGSRKVFAARGIFVGSEVFAVLLFWLQTQAASQPLGTDDLVLLVVDVVLIVLTVLIIGFPSRKRAS